MKLLLCKLFSIRFQFSFWSAFLFLTISLHSQSDSLNRLNAKGQKTGYWKVFLDSIVNVTDSANAFFYSYEFYDEGKLTYDIFKKTRNGHPSKVEFDGTWPVKGQPAAINGSFKFYRLNQGADVLNNVENYKNGFATTFEEYLFSDLPMSLKIDFTEKYNNTEGTFLTTDYLSYTIVSDTHRKTTCYWYRKVKKKWGPVETTCD